jgi:hypothetical protein
VVLDVAAYDNGDHVAELYLNPALRPSGGCLKTTRAPELRSRPRPVRYLLDLATGRATEEELAPITVELPTIDYLRLNGANTAISIAPGSATIRVPFSTTNSPQLIPLRDRTSPGGSLGTSRGSLSSFAALGLPLTMTESCSRLSWTAELAAPTCSPLTRRRWNRGPELSCRTTCPAGSTALFSRRLQNEPSERSANTG